jgi:glucose/arabinose dehydrogenase
MAEAFAATHVRAALACVTALTLAACTEEPPFDVTSQIGPNPDLPPLQQYLFPPMHLARVVGWKEGEKPTVADGLKTEALATGLQHPRSLYVLPNGDVLVVQSRQPWPNPIHRPKDLVMRWIESWVTSGGNTGPSNRITLLRDADGDGKPETQSVFLDHLNSPFGVALVGNELYVANTDAIVRYPYTTGDTKITAPGTILTPLPGGPIDHHWTKSLVASPDGALLYVGVGSNSNITENGMGAERNRAAIWEVERETGRWRIFASGLRNPNGLTFEPNSGAVWAVVNERDELGPNLVPDYMTSVKDGGFYGWPYSYWGRHLDPRVEPQRPDLVGAPMSPLWGSPSTRQTAFPRSTATAPSSSWDCYQFNGYKVVFVPFSSGRPNGKAEDVVTGFLLPP